MAERKPKTVPPCRLSVSDRDKCRLAAEYLGQGFDWSATVEGLEFWESIYDRLVDISEGAPLK